MKKMALIGVVAGAALMLQGCFPLVGLAAGGAGIAANAVVLGSANKSRCERAKKTTASWPKVDREKYVMNKGCM